MHNPGGTVEIPLTVFGGINQELQPSDLPQGLSPDCRDIAFLPGSCFTRPPLKTFSTLGTNAQVVYNTSFTTSAGEVVQFVCDSAGNMYANNVLIAQTAAGNRFQTCSNFGRLFIAISDGLHGKDVPLQYDGKTLSGVSQDGPGTPPVFAVEHAGIATFPVSGITQPPAGPFGTGFVFGFALQSTGPGVTAPGTVVTIYYSDQTVAPSDSDLVAAFQSGNPTYVYLQMQEALPGFGNPNTVLVTGVGQGQPPGQAHVFYYFTYTAPNSQALYSTGQAGYRVQYQRTLATVTTTAPVPGLTAGDSAVLAGDSVTSYDGTWTIAQTLGSGEMNISQTSVTGGTATYNYHVTSGAPPVAGQTISVTGTNNANGSLNVVNHAITSASGGAIGTFTIAGLAPTNYAAAAESGQAVTAGTSFTIDPASLTLGTTNSPIYGASTGGTLAPSAGPGVVTIAPGKRQGVVFFITRNGYLTQPSPTATFYCTVGTTGIVVSNIPIGPPDVVARGIAFTGADGDRFFYLPVPPTLNGQVNGTSTVVNDNTSTTATFNFTDASLLAASAIDIPGSDLFELDVLGPCVGFFAYAGRLFAWGERNKVPNLLNMGFEGGYVVPNQPTGWTLNGTGILANSRNYGYAWQVTGSGGGSDGFLSQPAFQDENGIAIIKANTQYSFRCWSSGSGYIYAQFHSPSQGIVADATFHVPPGGGYTQADFSNKTPVVMPADTVLTVQVRGMLAGNVTTLDDMEVFYTDNPYVKQARASYIDNPESFDGVTGIIGPASDPQPVMAMQERRDVLSLLTFGPAGSLYETEDTASGEPVTWNLRHVASECGIISALGITKFEDWFCWTSDTGLRIYDGGAVDKMSQEVQPLWDSFNPQAKQFTVLANDPYTRRIYLLCCTGAAITPNETWVLDYRELNTAAALTTSGTLRIGYSGKVITTDLTRKWCPWSMTMNYCGLVALGNGGAVMTFAGGNFSSVYTLDEGSLTGIDADFGPFWQNSYYSTYFFLSQDDAQQRQLGIHRLLHTFLTMNVTGIGAIAVVPMRNRLGNPSIPPRAVGLTLNLPHDLEFALNVAAERVSYRIQCQPTVTQAGFKLSSLAVSVKSDPFSPIRGRN